MPPFKDVKKMAKRENQMFYCNKEIFTINIVKQFNAKEYQPKIAQGIVGGISSRAYSVSVTPINFNTCCIRVITDHLPIFGSQADAKAIMTKIRI